jgi:hypothetical protein
VTANVIDPRAIARRGKLVAEAAGLVRRRLRHVDPDAYLPDALLTDKAKVALEDLHAHHAARVRDSHTTWTSSWGADHRAVSRQVGSPLGILQR